MSEHFTNTQYGFEWGAATITRQFSGRFGVCIELSTKRERLQIRVTPSGLIRTHQDKKKDNVFRA